MILSCLVVVAVAAGGIAVLRPQWLPQQLAGLVSDPAERSAQPAPPEGSPGEAASQDGPEASESLTAAEIRERMTGRRAGNRPARQQASEAGQAQTVAEAEPVGPASESSSAEAQAAEEPAERAVVDRRQPRGTSPERSVSREAPQRETAPMPPEQGLEELERRLAQGQQQADQSGSSRNARSDVAEGGPADQARRRSQADSQAAPAEGSSSSAPLSDGVAEYVRQWELPLAVRRNLPQLVLNIHVFSPSEEERFVLVNGERYVAGDSLGQGAKLVDIRREGAIVDFRSHRFLLEPR
jgi:hypothetical protein